MRSILLILALPLVASLSGATFETVQFRYDGPDPQGSVFVSGNLPQLGNSDLGQSLELVELADGTWEVDVSLPANRSYEFQFFDRFVNASQTPDPTHGTPLGEVEFGSTVAVDPATKAFHYVGSLGDPTLHWRQGEDDPFATTTLNDDGNGVFSASAFGEANRTVEFFLTGSGGGREPAALGGLPEDDPVFETGLEEIFFEQGQLFAYDPVPAVSPARRDYDPIAPPTIDSDFLDSARPYRVLLPRGYDEHPERYYPVVYCFDGQALFEDDTTVLGNVNKPWAALDPDGEVLSATIAAGQAHEAIFVGIDTLGLLERLRTGNPYSSGDGTPGPPQDWLNFLRFELKPTIDEQYRTLDGAEHTAVLGFEHGAGMSLFCAWDVPQVFGKAALIELENIPGIFSVISRDPKRPVELYLDSGLSQVRDFRSALLGKIPDRFILSGDLHYRYLPAEPDNPEAFRGRLPDALATLFPTSELIESGAASAAKPYWLTNYGLSSSDWDLDLDGDGLTTRDEYAFATNPLDASSQPSYSISVEETQAAFDFGSRPGVRYTVEDSEDLLAWRPYDVVVGDGDPFAAVIEFTPDAPSKLFFRLRAAAPIDSDLDGLSDVEEAALLGTRIDRADTDLDGFTDGDEVLYLGTDPLVPNTSGGSISGTVFADEDGDLGDGTPLAGATIFLDLNHNETQDPDEPGQLTNESGSYQFDNLAPGNYRLIQIIPAGNIQTFPGNPPGAPDGLPDAVEVDHVPFDIYDVPHGMIADPDLGSLIPRFPSPDPVPVDPELLLKPIGDRLRTFALGSYNTSEFITLTQGSSATVTFEDELIIDGTGFDFQVVTPDGQDAGEIAEIYAGAELDDMRYIATIGEGQGPIGFDLGRAGINFPVRHIRVTSLNNGGSFPGYELVGFQAVHYLPVGLDGHLVALAENEDITGIDFARTARDLPPRVFLSNESSQPRAGDELSIQVSSSDDFDTPTTTLTANGVPTALDGDGIALVTAQYPGDLILTATATDTAGQTASTTLSLLVRNLDGSLPSNPDVPGLLETTEGAPEILVHSPGPGAILATDVAVLATLSDEQEITSWELTYAPIELVDPYNLSAPDPDYVSLATGSGEVINSPLATLPVSTLADGVYLLRISVTDATATTAYSAHVIAKGIDPSDLYPTIEITAPQAGAAITTLTEILGTITSSSNIREWYVDVAPRAALTQSTLADNDAFIRIAEGTEAVDSESLLAVFDPTTLINDSYLIKVTAWNDFGLGWTEPIEVEVCGDFKPGRLRLETTDLELDLAGIPLEIRRVYDSYLTNEIGDFGHGWSLGFADPDIRDTDPDGGTNLSTNAWKVGTRIYLNAPDGRRIGFTFGIEEAASGFLGTYFRPVFTPDPGVYETLAVPEGDAGFLSQASDGSVVLGFIALPYNPDIFILTTKDGTAFTYHESEGLLDVRDKTGNTLVFTDDSVRHSSGAEVTFTRDEAGRITTVTAPDGSSRTYSYGAEGDLASTTDPAGNTTAYTYFDDPAHYLDSITDPLGRIGTRYEYDADGRLAAIIDENGNRSEQSYDLEGFSGTISDFRGNVTTIYYDDRGNVTREENPDGGVATYVYGDADHPDLETAVTDPLGHTTSYRYDDNGNITLLTPPAGNSLRQAFDEDSKLISRTRPGQILETFTYNEDGLLEEWGNHRSYTYTSDGRIATVTDSSDNIRIFGYGGAFGQLDHIENQSGATATATYAENGLPATASTTFGTDSYEYDDAGRLLRTVDPLGHEVSVTYLGDDPSTITDENGIATSYTYNSDGQLTEESTAGATTTFAYDADGNRTSVTDALGNNSTFTYDHAGRVLSATDAAGNTTTHRYDLAGNRIETIDRLGRKRSFEYDGVGSLTAERWHSPSDDSVVREILLTYDNAGKIDTFTDGELSYDHTHLASIYPTTMVVSFPGRDSLTLQHTYQDGDLLTRTELPGASSLIFNRSVTTEVALLRFSTPESGVTARADILRNGGRLPEQVLRYNDSSTIATDSLVDSSTWSYDENGRPVTIAHPSGTLTLGRDPGGRIGSLTDGAGSAAVSYDAINRVSGVDHPSGADESFSFDAGGNQNGDLLSAGNRLEARGDFEFDWDAEGNLIQRRNTSSGEVMDLTWDFRNRLTRVEIRPTAGAEPSAAIDYLYDYRDLLIGRVENGSTLWTIYDYNEMPVMEYRDDEAEAEAVYCFEPDGPDRFLGEWRSGQGVRWFHTDQTGSVRAVTDDTGATVATLQYGAFGEIRSLTETAPGDAGPIRYAGRWHDPVTGFSYNRARFYDPALGRFLSEDPIGFESGSTNLYAYANNTPYNYVDPSGNAAAVSYGTFTKKIAKRARKFGKKVGKQIDECFRGIADALEAANNADGPAGDTSSCKKAPTP